MSSLVFVRTYYNANSVATLTGALEVDPRFSDLATMGGTIHSHTFMPLPGTPLADAPPGRVTPEVESVLGRLSKDGLHTGQWQKQEELAAMIGC